MWRPETIKKQGESEKPNEQDNHTKKKNEKNYFNDLNADRLNMGYSSDTDTQLWNLFQQGEQEINY